MLIIDFINFNTSHHKLIQQWKVKYVRDLGVRVHLGGTMPNSKLIAFIERVRMFAALVYYLWKAFLSAPEILLG